jgi:glycerol kinase
MQAVLGRLDADGGPASTDQPDIGALLKTVGMTLVSTVGGAGGPLYGTMFLQTGTSAAGKSELTIDEWAAALAAGVDNVQKRGKAERGDKTMLDALMPAVEALQTAVSGGASSSAASAAAAESGMKATTPLVARKGRASYLGERSANHQDPRATSSWLLVRAAAERSPGEQRVKTRRRRREMADYAGALDQGTTSTRFMIFDHRGQVISIDQKEHEQIFPKPGWVEHNALEIRDRCQEVIDGALAKANLSASDLAAVGITNQRETTVVWDRNTGEPIHNAIVWQDTRTDKICDELAEQGGQDRFRATTGLPIATYFSGPKIKWMLDNVPGARERAAAGDLVFGNIDTWCIWNLTGGTDGGVHVTDVTNASRTLLMDLKTLNWDEGILATLGIPKSMLPTIRPSSGVYGDAIGTLAGIPVSGDLGDQQAALFGQTCFSVGEAKNTYGTGNFLVLNTGTTPVPSTSGLITGVGYKIGDQPATYMLEGSIAITGALVQWLRDNLKMIGSSAEVETLARTVEDNGGVYFVPAFSGLFAPYWRSDARGVIAGLTRYVNHGHIARAVLEATAWQSKEVVDAMNADSGVELTSLKVDGGMVVNELLMQFQADILGVPVIRPTVSETTALGAAYAAGLAVGFWNEVEDLRANWGLDKQWEPNMDPAQRDREYALWKKAVTRTFDWVE